MTHLTTAIDPEDAKVFEDLRDIIGRRLGSKPTKSGLLRAMIRFFVYQEEGTFSDYVTREYLKYGRI